MKNYGDLRGYYPPRPRLTTPKVDLDWVLPAGQPTNKGFFPLHSTTSISKVGALSI